ncbi:GntR family transcriptional regulator [Streptococcus halichoeri]|uniref:GntR family transcriptional regulator n=1 Tax=Streptococcus halichoeri TaxID=254785 RepID=UPI0013583DA4|nr:GntR family transcriptional regulator [Streptococcus halichoeri]
MAKEPPLYLQLVDQLELKIRQSMSANEKLLSERELIDVYQVSRITVRQALKELETRGLIYKKQGKGTFVSAIREPATDLAAAYSFTEHMKSLGKQPKTQMLAFEETQITSSLAKLFDMEVGTPVYELERLRLADNVPLMFERSFIPMAEFPQLSKSQLEKQPLYDVFAESYGQTIKLAEEEFYASIALDYEAELLHIQKGDPVLHMIRKTYNDKNILIEYTFSIARADHFRYRITHYPTSR